jgi:hypothetical protein
MSDHLLSRRTALGAAGVTGAALVTAPSLLTVAPAHAARVKVRARLDRSYYRPGDRMVLRVTERLKRGRKIRVWDSTGLQWKRISKTGNRQVWTARARRQTSGTVTVAAVRLDGRLMRGGIFRDRVRYRVVQATGPHLGGPAIVGMSSPAHMWDQRVREVGAGLAARRIFADLAAGPSSQMDLV